MKVRNILLISAAWTLFGVVVIGSHISSPLSSPYTIILLAALWILSAFFIFPPLRFELIEE